MTAAFSVDLAAATPVVVALLILAIGSRARRRMAATARHPHDAAADVGSTAAPHGVAASIDRAHRRRPHRRRRGVLAWTAGIALLAVVVDPLLAAIVLGARLAWPRVQTVGIDRRRRTAIERRVPDAIELMVLVIQAGLTPHQAVELMATRAPAPTRPGFAEVSRRMQRGTGLADALSGLPDTLGVSVASVADTLAIAVRHGTPIRDALEQLSIDVRQRRRRQAEAAARKLPVRLSFPLVACTLPSFVLVAIAPAVLAALSSLGGNTW